ncbi:MAG: hypothetical protein ABII06_09885 [Pseudomonadota bacterium]
MEEQLIDYEQKKRAIRFKKATRKSFRADPDEWDADLMDSPRQDVRLSDFVQVGSKVLIGGGIGLLAGVATIAVAASAAEVVIAGAITKVAGVVGGALGLAMGVNKYTKKKL